MNIKPIKTKKDYEQAMHRLEETDNKLKIIQIFSDHTSDTKEFKKGD